MEVELGLKIGWKATSYNLHLLQTTFRLRSLLYKLFSCQAGARILFWMVGKKYIE
jgi:hypothetical protein